MAVEPGSRLAGALGGDLAPIGRATTTRPWRSWGRGLRVTARAADGIVEGLEPDGDAWVVGVQWHPEDTAIRDPAQQRLFDAVRRRMPRPPAPHTFLTDRNYGGLKGRGKQGAMDRTLSRGRIPILGAVMALVLTGCFYHQNVPWERRRVRPPERDDADVPHRSVRPRRDQPARVGGAWATT